MKSGGDNDGSSPGPAAGREALDPSALLDRGRKAYAENRLREVVGPLRCLLVMEPGQLDGLVILAGALARTGATGTANVLFNRVNKLDVMESRHWRTHASVLIQARQLNAAHTLSRKILVKAPAEVAGFQGLARIMSLWGHNEDVRRILWRLHTLLPNDPSIATGLARAVMMAGGLAEAEVLCRRALDLAGDEAERLFDLGRVLRARGKFEEADEVLDRAVDLDPSLRISREVVQGTATEADFRATGEPNSDN